MTTTAVTGACGDEYRHRCMWHRVAHTWRSAAAREAGVGADWML